MKLLRITGRGFRKGRVCRLLSVAFVRFSQVYTIKRRDSSWITAHRQAGPPPTGQKLGFLSIGLPMVEPAGPAYDKPVSRPRSHTPCTPGRQVYIASVIR